MLRAASQPTEVGQRDFVRPRALMLSDTRLCYHHMTAWLMEHAQQIRTGLFGYSLPDRALTQGSTCVLLRVCWQVRDCSRAMRDKADWYNNMVVLSETTKNKTLWFIGWCNEERQGCGVSTTFSLTVWMLHFNFLVLKLCDFPSGPRRSCSVRGLPHLFLMINIIVLSLFLVLFWYSRLSFCVSALPD